MSRATLTLLALVVAVIATGAGAGGTAVLGWLVFGLLVWSRLAGLVRPARGAYGHGHGGSRAEVIAHEAGHIGATRQLGGRVRSAVVRRNGTGEVQATLPGRPRARAVRDDCTFLYAGAYAAGTRAGSGDDWALADKRLATLPADQRSRVAGAAHAAARRAAGSAATRAAIRDLTRKYG